MQYFEKIQSRKPLMFIGHKVKQYLKFISVTWKLLLFTLATGMLIVGSFFAGDVTWDVNVSVIMAFATYLSAPLSVGLFYRSIFIKKAILTS